jgi:hypothetical protein
MVGHLINSPAGITARTKARGAQLGEIDKDGSILSQGNPLSVIFSRSLGDILVRDDI